MQLASVVSMAASGGGGGDHARRSVLRGEGITAATTSRFPGRGEHDHSASARRRVAAASSTASAKIAVARLNLRNGWIKRGGKGAFHSLGAHVQVEGGRPGSGLCVHTFEPYSGEDDIAECLRCGFYNLAVSVRVPKASKVLRKDEARGFAIVFGYRGPHRFFTLTANLLTHVWALERHAGAVGGTTALPSCIQSHYQPPSGSTAASAPTRFRILLQVRGDSVTVDVNNTPYFTSVRAPGVTHGSPMAGTGGVAASGGQRFRVAEFAVFPPDVEYAAPQPAPQGVAGVRRGHRPSPREFMRGTQPSGTAASASAYTKPSERRRRGASPAVPQRRGRGSVSSGAPSPSTASRQAQAAVRAAAAHGEWAATPLIPQESVSRGGAVSRSGGDSAGAVSASLMSKLLARSPPRAGSGSPNPRSPPTASAAWRAQFSHVCAPASGSEPRYASPPAGTPQPPRSGERMRLSPSARAAAAASAAAANRRSPAQSAVAPPPVPPRPAGSYRQLVSAEDLARGTDPPSAAAPDGDARSLLAAAKAWSAQQRHEPSYGAMGRQQDHAGLAAAAASLAPDGPTADMPVPRYETARAGGHVCACLCLLTGVWFPFVQLCR